MQIASASCKINTGRSRFILGVLALVALIGAIFWTYRIETNQPLFMLVLVFAAGLTFSSIAAVLAATIAFTNLQRNGRVELSPCETDTQIVMPYPVLHPLLGLLAPARVFWQAGEAGSNAPELELEIDSQGRERCSFPRRCVINYLRRLVVVSDHLGLFRFAIEQVAPSRILVIPRRRSFQRLNLDGAASDLDMRPDLSGAREGDFIETRQYQEGESAKNMLWKVAARTGGQRLIVRTEERITGSKVAIYFLATGEGDDVAAEFVRSFTEKNGHGFDWILGVSGDRTVYSRDKKALALEAIARTGCISEYDWAGLQNFTGCHAPRFGVRTPTIVVGGESGSEINGLLSLIAAKCKGSTIIFCPLGNLRSTSRLSGRVRIAKPVGGKA
jgi:hypothetical protein